MLAASPTLAWRLAVRLNAVGISASEHSMPKPKRSAGSATRPRPRPLTTPKLSPRVVTQLLFSPSLYAIDQAATNTP